MALIKCPECGREISDKAKTCPHCGCPVEVQESPLPAEKNESTSSKQLDLQPLKKEQIPSKKNNMLAICIIICFVLFAFCLSKCGNKSEQVAESTTDTTTTVNVIADAKKDVEEPYDSAKVDSLKKYFRIEKDEFSGVTWYYPKNSPKYRNSNSLFCYFGGTEHEATTYLRIVIQYYASDWLFIDNAVFLIDDKTYVFNNSFNERDNAGYYIWEWIDMPISSINDKEIVEAITNAKTVKIKFNGRQYHDVKTLSSAQISAVKQSLDLYRLMKGEW